MKILLTGATGFVGGRLFRDLDGVIAAPSLREADAGFVRRVVEESEADVIIHTAAISEIGVCEKDPEASYRANVELPVLLAKAAGGRKLVCFSSDQVYSGCDGEGPYTEETVKPANTYAAHKIEMEKRVLDICPDAVLLRAEWMYDFIAPRPNYFTIVTGAEKPLSFSRKNYRGVTYLGGVSASMPKVFGLPGGCYNYGSEVTRPMYEITTGILARLGKDIPVAEPTRPGHNLWMDCSKARKYGVDFDDVEVAFFRCLEDSRKNKALS